jgi:hypothetical protein
VSERTLPLPSHVVRRLLAPAFLGVLLTAAAALLTAVAALLTAAAATIRRHARQPALPRMSEHWLRSYDANSGHQSEFWRDRW